MKKFNREELILLCSIYLGKWKVGYTFDDSEPVPCQRRGCKEENNGLNCYYVTFGQGFRMEMWLCDKCSSKFVNRPENMFMRRRLTNGNKPKDAEKGY